MIVIYQFDWSTEIFPIYIRYKPKKHRIKKDIGMILNIHNIHPLNEWFDIWKQLVRDIIIPDQIYKRRLKEKYSKYFDGFWNEE